MNKIRLLFFLQLSFFIFNSQKVQAQIVYIPDANFKAALVGNSAINTNGDSQIQVSEANAMSGTLAVPYHNISDLTGIAAFTNITSLYCNDNLLTSLDLTANTALISLTCSNNQLDSLSNLPNSLTILYCENNQISSLPTLPNSLLKLNCSYNQLSSLPALPNSLTELGCTDNQLSSLPTLPNSLIKLSCNNNQLSSLPSLPNSITLVSCGHNQLTSLPNLPSSLTNLSCSINQLTNLPILPDPLKTLSCYYNQLTSLPVLPDSLTILYCSNNQLINFPTMPNTLTQLDCSNNHLTSLPSLSNSLTDLVCGPNLLTSLPALPNSLTFLDCRHNFISSLPTIPSSLTKFIGSQNQINSLPVFPDSMDIFKIDNNYISCLSNLPKVTFANFNANINNNPLHCVPNQTNYSGNLPMCVDNDPINNPNNCQSVVNITGSVYLDSNTNCNYENTDWITQNIPIKLFDTQNNLLQLSYTINGVFSFAGLQPDSFIVKIEDVALPLDMACGQANYQMVHLDTTNQTIANINFPVVCDSAFDLQVHSISHQGWVHPGQEHLVETYLANAALWYNLNCTNANSGSVSIQVSGPVSFISPESNALTPIVNGNVYTYNINNFNNITPASFGLKFLTDTTAQAGNQICVHVTITPNIPDADTTNNEFDFCYNILNSIDPNMKEVYPTDVLPGYNDWFTYTIHFQNTGNAPAFNIRLRDTLDAQLDLNTFEYLGASHTAKTNLIGNVLSVRFNNMMLPDSTSDYNGSMGYYQYRVKPKPNLLNVSTIKNTAYIYFDYNPAVVTNTTENHFDITTALTPSLREGWGGLVYPNPSKGIFTFKNSSKISTVEVYNLYGKVLLRKGNCKSIDLTDYPKGVYFAKVNGSFVNKLVKE